MYKILKYNLLCSLFLFVIPVFGQTSDKLLFEESRKRGIEADSAGNFRTAIDQFFIAWNWFKGEDLDSLIQNTLDKWVDSLEYANTRSQDEKETADSFRVIAQINADSAMLNAKKAMESKAEMRIKGILAEAHRLALLSNNALSEAKDLDALFLAYSAINLLNQPPDSISNIIKLAFGNAVFASSKQLFKLSARPTYIEFTDDSNAYILLEDSSIKQILLPSLDVKSILTLNHLVYQLKVNTNNGSVLICTTDSIARIINPDGSFKRLEGHHAEVTYGDFNADGRKVITCSRDKTAILWDNQGDTIKTLSGHSGFVYGGSFSSAYIHTRSSDGTVIIWDSLGDHWFSTPIEPYIYLSSFSPSGNFMAYTGSDSTLKLVNLENRDIVSLFGHSDIIQEIQFCERKDRLVTRSLDSTLRVWDYKGNNLYKVNTPDFINSLDINKKGDIVLFSSDDHTAKIWRLNQDSILTLVGHQGPVFSAHFSPDEKYILTTSKDGTSRIWDLAGHTVMVLDLKSIPAFPSQFSPSGKYVISVFDDRFISYCPLPKVALKHMQEIDLFSESQKKDFNQIYEIEYFNNK